MNRRGMLTTISCLMAGSPFIMGAKGASKEMRIGLRAFDVREFGAAGDGKTLDSASINQAIVACYASGGGMVYVPPGLYLSGTVVLRSNVTLFLEAGATILGSKDINDYPVQTGPVIKGDIWNQHLIFARDAENIGLAGRGMIDGQGAAFWAPNGKVIEPEDSWRRWSGFGWDGVKPRPSPMLEFFNCKNLHIENIKIQNSAGWTLRPIHCDNVFIRGITIRNPVHAPNADGIDPTCCQNVFISDCLIETGDDAICLKSESCYGEQLRPTKNVTITNCVISCCCNGLKLGTRTQGAFENVVFNNSVIFNEDAPLHARVISGIALEMVDGGSVEGVLVSNIRMQRVRTPIFIRRGNRSPRSDGTPGTLRGVMIENIHATGSALTSSVTGLPGFDVEDVTLSNIRIDSDEPGKTAWASQEIPEKPTSYPEANIFGRWLPAYGLYARHVTGLRLRNVEFRSAGAEERPALYCDDVKELDVCGMRSEAVGEQTMIKLVQSKRAFLHGCSAGCNLKTFLEIQGDRTENIALAGNSLGSAAQMLRRSADVPRKAVLLSGNAIR